MLSDIKKNLFILALLPLLTSCAMSHEVYKDIDAPAAAGDYQIALDVHEEKSPKIYSKNDIILSNLNSGMLNHYAKQYENSNKKLTHAEELIFHSYGLSISDAVASSVVNDNLKDYTGEDYEDIYINVFKALNFIALDDQVGAMVEIRRINRKLTELRKKYEAEIIKTRKDFNELDIDLSKVDTSKSKINLEFTDSAFARYISMLLYRANNNSDGARIDKRYIEEAFKIQPSLYNFPIPKHLDEDINIPNGMARLNVVSFSGCTPVKESEDIRLFLDELYIKISLPKLVKRPTMVSSVEVIAINTETEEKYSTKLEKMESIENIVIDTFNQKLALLYAKSILRSISKAMVTNETTKAVGGTAAAIGPLAQILLGELTENADTRISHYFPANIYTTGLTLEEGIYDIAISYKTASGSTLYVTRKKGVEVFGGRSLNLIESTYLN